MPGEKGNDYDPATLPDLLNIYYKRLFPYGPYYRWLNYGGVPKKYFTHREFSFTLADDVYLRYQSFTDQAEMEKEIQKRCPHKIDIGAVFTYKPREHKTVKAAAFQAEEKELVFDIDMTDYDDVRKCCSGADICLKCWPLMVMAVKIIDRALRDDFGYEHLLWVYSGRRGIHCWVCDEGARKLSQTGRTAIAEYLSVVKGGENQIKKVTLHDSVHPSIGKAIQIIEDHFDDYAVKKQDFMDTDEDIKKVVALAGDEDFRDLLEGDFQTAKATSTANRWKIIKHRSKETKTTKTKQKHSFRKCHQLSNEIMLQYAYPRLDVNVSKGVNHLLKSPFCVHPKTGRVCVPMNVDTIDSFNPFKVPTISTLCDELDDMERQSQVEESDKKQKGYKSTSLREGVQVFEAFLKKLEASQRGKRLEQSDMRMEI